MGNGGISQDLCRAGGLGSVASDLGLWLLLMWEYGLELSVGDLKLRAQSLRLDACITQP